MRSYLRGWAGLQVLAGIVYQLLVAFGLSSTKRPDVPLIIGISTTWIGVWLIAYTLLRWLPSDSQSEEQS